MRVWRCVNNLFQYCAGEPTDIYALIEEQRACQEAYFELAECKLKPESCGKCETLTEQYARLKPAKQSYRKKEVAK